MHTPLSELRDQYIKLGELVDRVVIELLNALVKDDEEKFYKIFEDLFNDADADNIKSFDIFKLIMLNSRIWGLESAIRNRRDNNLSLTDIGFRTSEIRELNEQRCAIKRIISTDAEIINND